MDYKKGKKCPRCNKIVIESYYSKDRNKPDGLGVYCKKCAAEKRIEWRKRHPEDAPNYYQKNRERINSQHSEYNKTHVLEIKEQKTKYYLKNYEKIAATKKRWQENNSEKFKQLKEGWKKRNPKYHTEYMRERRRSDISFRMRSVLGTRLQEAMKNNSKKSSIVDYLGCSVEELKQHLQSQFKEGMSWDNYGKKEGQWSIDHILPCSSFDHTDEEQIKKCWHYTNMQPMWHVENMKKGKKLNYESQNIS